LNENIFLII